MVQWKAEQHTLTILPVRCTAQQSHSLPGGPWRGVGQPFHPNHPHSRKGKHIDTTSECVLHRLPQASSALPLHLLCLHLSRDGVSRRTVPCDLSLLQLLTATLFTGSRLLDHRSTHVLLCQCGWPGEEVVYSR